MKLLSFVSNICDPGRSLSLEWQMLHMFPFSLDCKTVSGLNSWTTKGDLLSIIMTICGQGVVVVAVAVSGWREDAGFQSRRQGMAVIGFDRGVAVSGG